MKPIDIHYPLQLKKCTITAVAIQFREVYRETVEMLVFFSPLDFETVKSLDPDKCGWELQVAEMLRAMGVPKEYTDDIYYLSRGPNGNYAVFDVDIEVQKELHKEVLFY